MAPEVLPGSLRTQRTTYPPLGCASRRSVIRVRGSRSSTNRPIEPAAGQGPVDHQGLFGDRARPELGAEALHPIGLLRL